MLVLYLVLAGRLKPEKGNSFGGWESKFMFFVILVL